MEKIAVFKVVDNPHIKEEEIPELLLQAECLANMGKLRFHLMDTKDFAIVNVMRLAGTLVIGDFGEINLNEDEQRNKLDYYLELIQNSCIQNS